MARRGISQSRRDREWDVIDVASKHLNTMGVSLEWFTAVAVELGVSRPALYNHVVDRDDLQFKCYIKSCDALDQALITALNTSDTPTEVLDGFLGEINRSDEPEFAIMREMDALPEQKRIRIRARQDALVSRLADIIQQGVAAGLFRSVDTSIVAEAFMGMAGWLSIYRRWTSGMGTPHPTRGMKELLFRGLVVDRHTPFFKSPRLAPPSTAKIDVFDRSALDDAKREGILVAASALFNRRGIGATRVEDVGAAIGLSKRAMFHHIHSKNALIDACIERATAFNLNLMAAAEASAVSRIEAFFAAIRDYVESICDPDRTVLVPDVGAGLVGRARWLAMADFHRQLTDGYRKILTDGQHEGSIRLLPLEDVLPSLPSVINWVSGRSLPSEEDRRNVADELATLVTRGILR